MHEGCVGESLQARLVLARVERSPRTGACVKDVRVGAIGQDRPT